MSGSIVIVVALLLQWRWLPSFEIGPLQAHVEPPAPREERAPPRTTLAGAPALVPAALKMPVQLPEEIILRTLDTGRATFLACWRRAVAADPMIDSTKVKIRVELDEVGTITSVTHDAANTKLGNCLVMVTRSLRFTAPMQRAVAEFPLFFQAE